MKVLIISDGQNWIVDRISSIYKDKIPHDIDIATRSDLSPNRLAISVAPQYDLIHFNNWGFEAYSDAMDRIETPIIMSVRSRRYKPFVFQLAGLVDKVHVLSDLQLEDFPGSIWIPDGVFVDSKQAKPFKIGMAFQDIPENYEYKGYYLVKRACDFLGLTLEVAKDKKPEEMVDWYKSLSLFVCASNDEGFSAPAMECMALNVPVLTTDVGAPRKLVVHKADRTFESLVAEISKFYTAPQVLPLFSWDTICMRMGKLYEDTVKGR
jgi:hypothetical protein